MLDLLEAFLAFGDIRVPKADYENVLLYRTAVVNREGDPIPSDTDIQCVETII